MIEVHNDGNIRRFHGSLNKMLEVNGVGVLSRARGNLQNHGSFFFVRRFHDRLNHFHVVHVERADRVAARIGFFKHFG